MYKHMNIKYLQTVFISSFLPFSILSGIRSKIYFYYEFVVNRFWQFLTLGIVFFFYILRELEVFDVFLPFSISFIVLKVLFWPSAFISVVFTFSTEKFNIFGTDLKKEILIKVQIKMQHP